jgi:hypothetical protein
MTTSTGIVLPQHYDNPDSLGIEHLKIVSSSPISQLDALLVDIKDVFGNVFFKTKSPFYKNRLLTRYTSYFREIMAACEDHDVVRYFGIPGLYDAGVENSAWCMRNAKGEAIQGWLCPNSSQYVEHLTDLLREVAKFYPGSRIFLPFLRFRPIADEGFTCFCERCKKLYKDRFDKQLSVTALKKDPASFSRWVGWRCERISQFLDELMKGLKETGCKLALEIDIDPERHFDLGIKVNDGHDLQKLADSVDEFVVHFYDRSKPPSKPQIGSELGWNVAALSMERLRRLGKPISLFSWGITSRSDLHDRVAMAETIEPERAFYLLFPNQIAWLDDIL